MNMNWNQNQLFHHKGIFCSGQTSVNGYPCGGPSVQFKEGLYRFIRCLTASTKNAFRWSMKACRQMH
jgi:hypothetical protein